MGLDHLCGGRVLEHSDPGANDGACNTRARGHDRARSYARAGHHARARGHTGPVSGTRDGRAERARRERAGREPVARAERSRRTD